MNTSHKNLSSSSLSFSLATSHLGFTVHFVSPSCCCSYLSSLPAFFILSSFCLHLSVRSFIYHTTCSPSTSAIKIPALHAEKQQSEIGESLKLCPPALYQLFRCSPPPTDSFSSVGFGGIWHLRSASGQLRSSMCPSVISTRGDFGFVFLHSFKIKIFLFKQILMWHLPCSRQCFKGFTNIGFIHVEYR